MLRQEYAGDPDRNRATKNGSLQRYRSSEINSATKTVASSRCRKVLLVDPVCCRLWDRHQRRYDLLDEDRCNDLIEAFLTQGRQEFPAICRSIKGDKTHLYEIICGARRYWTVNWLQKFVSREFKYLIEVRNLTDEQCFRLADIENRGRKDLSDYERASDYRLALKLYYRSQKEMATRLNMTESRLSRHLSLARLPDEIVEAYSDIREIRTYHATELAPVLKKAKRLVLEEADRIAKEQRHRRAACLDPIGAAKVLKRMKGVTNKVKRRRTSRVTEYRGSDGAIVMTSDAKERSLVVSIRKNPGTQRDELIKLFSRLVDEQLFGR